MTARNHLLTRARDTRSRHGADVLERSRAAQAQLDRIQARADQIRAAGFLGAFTDASGPEPMIGTRGPCNASLRIPLDGPLPVCGATCGCPPDAKRRAKEKFGR